VADVGQERPLLDLGTLQAGGHVVEGRRQLGDLVVTVDMDPCRQVATTDPAGGPDQPAERRGEPAGQQPGGQRRRHHRQGGGQQQPPGHHREQAEAEAPDLVDQQHTAPAAAEGPLGGGDRPGQPVAGAGDDLSPGEGRGQVGVGDGGELATAVGELAGGQPARDGVHAEDIDLGLPSPQGADDGARRPARAGPGDAVGDGLCLVGELLLKAPLGQQPDQRQGDDADQRRGQDGHGHEGQHQPTPQRPPCTHGYRLSSAL
jgi:hypothetical protein